VKALVLIVKKLEKNIQT